ncbi:hypothetical protein CLOM_g17225 [Closterium sp. NIES-68]|nr:hypothetical protein CLOM_g17225 [Closterium sp. NIES-68]GJP67251.1 hypothetical protein CLOP_g24094 [Closterium sp. NIES-67]
MASRSDVLRVYRHALRVADRHITAIAGNRFARDAIREMVRADSAPTSDLPDGASREPLPTDRCREAVTGGDADEKGADKDRRVLLLKDWADLVDAIHSHKNLLRSYNIDIDREAELKARLRDTARRVGLQITPQEDWEPPTLGKLS